LPQLVLTLTTPNMADKQYLIEAAKAVEAKLPDHEGFILMAIPFKGQGDNRLKYISNLDRADAINVLKEWLIQSSGEEEWMKHL